MAKVTVTGREWLMETARCDLADSAEKAGRVQRAGHRILLREEANGGSGKILIDARAAPDYVAVMKRASGAVAPEESGRNGVEPPVPAPKAGAITRR